MGVTILTDSGCDFSPAEASAKGIGIIPVYMLYGTEKLRDGVDIDRATFLRRLAAGEIPKTEPGSVDDYKAAFEKHVSAGNEVVYISISAAISKCYENAVAAAASFPGKVFVVDSTAASGIETLLSLYAVELVKSGMSASAVAEKLKTTKSASFFSVPDMKHMAAGGRIPKAVAALGAMLNVSLVLKIANGTISPAGQTRSIDKTRDLMVESTLRAVDRSPAMRVAITHVAAPDLAKSILVDLTTKLGHPPAQEFINESSPTLSANLGAGAVGVFAIIP